MNTRTSSARTINHNNWPRIVATQKTTIDRPTAGPRSINVVTQKSFAHDPTTPFTFRTADAAVLQIARRSAVATGHLTVAYPSFLNQKTSVFWRNDLCSTSGRQNDYPEASACCKPIWSLRDNVAGASIRFRFFFSVTVLPLSLVCLFICLSYTTGAPASPPIKAYAAKPLRRNALSKSRKKNQKKDSPPGAQQTKKQPPQLPAPLQKKRRRKKQTQSKKSAWKQKPTSGDPELKPSAPERFPHASCTVPFPARLGERRNLPIGSVPLLCHPRKQMKRRGSGRTGPFVSRSNPETMERTVSGSFWAPF